MPHIELSNLLWLIEIFIPSIDQTLFVVISSGTVVSMSWNHYQIIDIIFWKTSILFKFKSIFKHYKLHYLYILTTKMSLRLHVYASRWRGHSIILSITEWRKQSAKWCCSYHNKMYQVQGYVIPWLVCELCGVYINEVIQLIGVLIKKTAILVLFRKLSSFISTDDLDLRQTVRQCNIRQKHKFILTWR